MVSRLLVPTDGSEPAIAALEHAASIAVATGATAHVLHVSETSDEDDPVAEQIVAEGVSWVEDADATALGESRSGSPSEETLEYAAEIDADLIVLGTHARRGIERLVLGSVTEATVRRAERPVLVVSARSDTDLAYPYQRIVVGVDGSDHSTTALQRAVELASPSGTVHLLSVVDVTPINVEEPIRTQFEAAAKSIVSDVEDVARAAGAKTVETEVTTGAPADEICSYAADVDADLVAIGTHGRRGVDRLLLGSVAERVLRTAPMPVLTVHTGDR